MGGREVGGLANMLAAHMNIEDASHRERVQRFWRSPTIATQPGLKAVDMFRAVADGRIKALWIMATNPVVSMPDAGSVEAAIRACPFVVVSDVTAATDTARLAHVRLPAAAWGEKNGTVTNSERRISRQRQLPARRPVTRVPIGGSSARLPTAWASTAPSPMRSRRKSSPSTPRCPRFENEWGARLRHRRDLAALDDVAIRGLDAGAMAARCGPAFAGAHVRRRTLLHARRQGALRRREAGANVQTAPGFPLTLNTGRVRDHWHTMTRTGKSQRLSQHCAEPFVEIHPQDAARFRIGDADLVRVSTGLGAILVRALLTPRQQVGSIFVPMHWNDQFASRARVDVLAGQ